MWKKLKAEKSENREEKIRALLEQKFEKVHVSSILKHFIAAKREYQGGDWEDAIEKSGKFVEATTKALMRFCGKTLPKTRHFHAGTFLRNLEQEPTTIDDAVRIVIPKCCLFLYEIANNRGARHDPDEVDPNEIDASVANVSTSWILGELIRFSSKGNKNPEEAQELVKALTGKIYSVFEKIEDRFYVNVKGLSAKKIALLILHGLYPKRINEKSLRDLVGRHGFSSKNSEMAFRSIKHLCDISANGLQLRGLGRQEAEMVLVGARPRGL